MCFSPEASFAVGGALIPAAGYCLRAAWLKNPRLIPIALMPLAFAVQQIAEGVVWLGLHAGDPAQIRAGALAFLFFALAFWPFWLPFIAAVNETRPGPRRFFVALTVLSSGWFWAFYLPLLIGPDSLLSVRVVHHSILYSYSDAPLPRNVPQSVLRLLYSMSVVVPLVFGPKTLGRLPGLTLLSALLVAVTVYEYAFVSVWCFFAAVLTLSLCAFFYRMSAPAIAPGATAQA